jgi:Protein of unknown function (DUF992)
MPNVRPIAICGAILSSITLFSAEQVSAQSSARSGVLTCQTSASIGLLVGSRQGIRCRFIPDGGGRPEIYTGRIGRLGLDIGVTAGGTLGWVVLTRTKRVAPGSLAGTYVGGSGDIALGVGVGANALIGGSNNSVALQPFSIEGQVGVNLALGVAALTLVAAR